MVYVISDLHGIPLDDLKALLEKAEFSQNDYCYVLGDVVDRGKHGVELLKWIMAQRNFELIMGNHERMMLDCREMLEEGFNYARLNGMLGRRYDLWSSNGGGITYETLSTLRYSELKYIFEYVEKAKLYKEITVGDKKYVLTHCGLGNFEKDRALDEYSEHDLVWSRPRFEQRYYDDKTVIFGHTPTLLYGSEYKGKMLKTETWIDIDVGCACGLNPAILRLDDLRIFYL